MMLVRRDGGTKTKVLNDGGTDLWVCRYEDKLLNQMYDEKQTHVAE